MRNAAENYALGQIEHEEKHSAVKEAMQYVHKAQEASQISLQDFVGVYPPEKIQKDAAYVQDLRLKFAAKDQGDPGIKEAKEAADLFECVLTEQCEQSNWLGQDFEMQKTTLVDDFRHGVDSVGEVVGEEGATQLAVSVDATIGSGEVRKKMQRIAENIRMHRMTELEYFHSNQTGYTGPLKDVPHVVLGVSGKILNELAEMWIETKKGVRGSKQTLALSPVRGMILHELHAQVTAFQRFAEIVGNQKAVAKYGQLGQLVTNALNEATTAGFVLEEQYDDDVFNQIMHVAEHELYTGNI